MLRKNNFFWGCLLGAVGPILAWLFTDAMKVSLSKPLLLYVIAALVNLLLLRYFYRNELEKSARGVIFFTFICFLLLIFLHPQN